MRCLYCDRPLGTGSLKEMFMSEDLLCSTCRSAWKPSFHTCEFEGLRLCTDWEYNEAFARALLQFKDAGDEALKDVFLLPHVSRLRRMYRGRTLCLLPSRKEKVEARGFHHLRLMYECLGLPMLEPFESVSETEQKTLSRQEREKKKILLIHKDLPKRIVCCDDVLTTGSTMRAALACLPEGLDVCLHACASVPLKDLRSS